MTDSSPTRIFIYGLSGKMGKEIASLITATPTLDLVGGSSRSTPSPLRPCDIAIDFSTPENLHKVLQEATALKVPLLIGTTGLTSSQKKFIQEASKTIPILLAPNTSFGITLLQDLVERAAAQLDLSYDIEIFETHHRQKIDAPSGTALCLGESAETGRQNQPEHLPLDRNGEKRSPGAIGYAVHRGGSVPGDHSVRFIGDEEIIELSHRSLSRSLFARGALKAALWLNGKNSRPPSLYTMKDILS